MTEARRERLVAAGVLAVPFLVAIAVLQGLTVEIDTFHGTDAGLYHLPTIRQFAEHVDLSSYPAAQTPLYHLLFAGFGKVAGFEPWKLRLLNAAISYGAALALLRLLRRATPLEPLQALALTLVFTLSPYFFGASFTLLTDNLALLFAFLALERAEAFRRSGSFAPLALACLALCAAVLTRQSFVWLAAVAGWFVLRAALRPGRRLAGLALVGAALLPLLGLVIAWDGLVPKGSDPGSCGLCGDQPGGEGLSLRPVGFTLALLGAYAAVLFGPAALRRARELPAPQALAGALAGGVALLLVSPLSYEPKAPSRPGDGGWLWKVADRVPEVAGSSLLFFVLVPAGLLALWLLVRRAGVESLPAVAFAFFLLAALPVRLVYQKYFDPMVLVTLALLARPPDLRTRRDYAGAAVLCVAFVAYAVSFSGD
ncbi:MAG: hypothetical protein JW895_01390 [Thermoleophilaceae bacterium]|nr:hypothetical protein [Thermoleophilaceae bacterium]